MKVHATGRALGRGLRLLALQYRLHLLYLRLHLLLHLLHLHLMLHLQLLVAGVATMRRPPHAEAWHGSGVARTSRKTLQPASQTLQWQQRRWRDGMRHVTRIRGSDLQRRCSGTRLRVCTLKQQVKVSPY